MTQIEDITGLSNSKNIVEFNKTDLNYNNKYLINYFVISLNINLYVHFNLEIFEK